ncbi:hypothetical protein V6N11_025096 [Hibiscus sabdariffa]|uniref:Rab-GAP TBC domain-containing protein n=1 Tax=Hibiscus sabdariffa TaxID=183260 RepID=A0ABR2QP33_9ROSI
MWRAVGEPADSYYPIRPECTDDVPRTRFKIKPGKTLSARKWQAAFSPDGHLDIGKTLRRIQRGYFSFVCKHRGSIHRLGEKFGSFCLAVTIPRAHLMKGIKYGSIEGSNTLDGRTNVVKSFPLLEVANISQHLSSLMMLLPRGPFDKKVIQWLLTLHQIGLDVIRTDRTLVFYEKQENLSKLWDILSVYAWIDTDVGYGQGK